MGYANPIEAMGVEKFVAAAKAAGVDGVIVVDYPPEECGPFADLCGKAGIDSIFLLAPTSTDARIREVARAGSGLPLLRVAEGRDRRRKPRTWPRSPRSCRGCAPPPACRSASASASGTPNRRARSRKFADAVVIGSRIVQEIESAGAEHAVARVKALLIPIRKALDA